ncbi:MAG TPA: hypothetical protein VH371_11345 [Candidatus Limnocylindrales bacterium]
MADEHVAALRAAGYEVELCGGPEETPCPVRAGLPCPLADRADVLVYDAWLVGGGNAARDLVADVRETYPDLPIVLTSVEPGIDWVEVEGPHRVTPIAGQPSPDELREAVGSALADQGMAV